MPAGEVFFPKSELERIVQNAELRSLPNSAFVRMIVAGAIAQGGGTLDRLLVAGEKIVTANTVVRRRGGYDYMTDWEIAAKGERGRYRFKKDPRWVLYKRPHLNVKGDNKKDPQNWWKLYGPDHVGVPMALTRPDAMRVASEYIKERV